MNPLHRVGTRLAIALAIVLALALGLVDLIVVPSLERNLIDAKLAQLRDAAPGVAAQLSPLNEVSCLTCEVQTASASSNARVAILTGLGSDTVLVFEDSNLVSSDDLANDPLALRASRLLQATEGTVRRSGERYAEAAIPLEGDFVVLLSAPLHDALANVDLVRRRLLIAGLIALVASISIGYVAATLFARRIRRLERAADRIAGGDFSQEVRDHGTDELGELATAFERMRGRLGQLEHARREFIANASHELRTPLFSLGGFLELMENEELDESTRREFMATMREQIDRLTKLATDLLDLSRLDAGRLRVETEQVDLNGLVRILADEFRAVARARGHELAVAVNGGAPALADEERALQIGRVLVENALVHTPPGTAVRLSSCTMNGSAVLEVEDGGSGIPHEHVPHVFERFYRAESTVASGSGLGLAIARELAELMGGTIQLETAPGRTVFRLLLRRSSSFGTYP